MQPGLAHEEVFYSDLAADPDLADLIDLFVQELPTRLADLRQAIDSGDFERVRRLAHQLKGAGGSHGFPQLGPPAAKLELAASRPLFPADASSLLDELILTCSRLRPGRPT